MNGPQLLGFSGRASRSLGFLEPEILGAWVYLNMGSSELGFFRTWASRNLGFSEPGLLGTRASRVGRRQYKIFIFDDPVKSIFEGPGEVRLVNLGSKSNPSLQKPQNSIF